MEEQVEQAVGRMDPFILFRTTLFVFLGIYTLLTMAGTMWQVLRVLRGSDPQKRLLRLYLSYQLVSIRIRPLSGELLQLGAWAALLLAVWWLHTKV